MDGLTELLNSLARWPQCFVHPVSYGTVQGYLRGLAAGLRIAGFEWTRDDYHAAAAARGWDPRGDMGILRDFTNKGLSDIEMARELVAVEADAYARAMARSGRSASPSAPADPGPDRQG